MAHGTLCWISVIAAIFLSIGIKRLYSISAIEYEHNYYWETRTTLSPVLEGGEVIGDRELETPDFREEEPPWVAYTYKKRESNRPFRLSPHWRMISGSSGKDTPYALGCCCAVVYKRLLLLSACAVITSRHFLTTASSVELILEGHRHLNTLENILGVWYDHNYDVHNSSYYASVARIHYHPMFNRPKLVNRSHPLPCVFDLAVMASTYNVFGWYGLTVNARICPRATGHSYELLSPTPRWEMLVAVGYQFMWSTKRKPTPFHKYGVRTRDYIQCPKVEWGYFVCLMSHHWGRFGMDSGGCLFRCFQGTSWRWSGLLGIHTVAMRLRSTEQLLYYTILDTHPVLDFLYEAYMGRLPYEYLDFRFEDTQWAAPKPHKWARINKVYVEAEQNAHYKRWW